MTGLPSDRAILFSSMDLTGGPSRKRPRVSLEDVNVKRVQKMAEDHNDELCASILKLKADEDVCDVTINCRDFEVKVHKMILVASSDYFKAMFQNDTKESQSQIVDFSSMDPDVVRQIVDFIYTGSVWITMDTARGLLDAAEIMQLPKLSELCVEFLAENVDMKSCAEVMSLIRLYKKQKLNLVLQNFLERYFEQFRKTTDFLSLDYIDLVDCLKFLKKGCSPLEEQKWFGILSWTMDRLERKENFNALFKMIDLHCLPNDFLRDSICCEDVVSGSVECLQLILNVILNKRNPLKKLDRTNDEWKMSGIVSVNSRTHIVYQYHVTAQRWSRLTKLPEIMSSWDICSITMHQGMIYVGDGQTLCSFDGNGWKDLFSAEEYQPAYNVCFCFRRLVVMVSIANTVIFNTDSNLASCIPRQHSSGFFIATSTTDLYVMGGTYRNIDSNQVEMLRLAGEVGTYSYFPSLTLSRVWGKALWYDDTLYALGGGQGNAEFFNSITEQWQLIKDLTISCYMMKTHIANNKLYIFDGTSCLPSSTFDLDKLHVSEEDRQPTLRDAGVMKISCVY